MQVWNVLHAARWKYRTQKCRKNRHLCTIAQLCRAVSSQLRHVSTIGKKVVKQQYLFHKSPQYGELRPTSGWDSFGSSGHPGKFQRASRLGFVTAVTSFTGGQPHFARCLAIYWAATLYIHFLGLLPPHLTEFRRVQESLGVQIFRSVILAALLHGTPAAGSAKLCGVVQGMELRNFRRGRHLYSAGRSSRWASAHILVIYFVVLCSSVTITIR